MNKNILLIYPSNKVLGRKDNSYTHEALTPNLGIGYLAASLRKRDIGCSIVDLRLPHRTINDILSYIKEFKPILVGITAFTNEVTAAGKIARLIKDQFSRLPIILGGPHASSIPIDSLKEFSGVDIVCIGEGEETVVELTHNFLQGNADFGAIKGIAFKKDDEIIINPARETTSDIDQLPFPAWDLFELEYYNRIFMISSSRGCPYACYFCNPGYLGGRTRARGYIQIADELEKDVKDFDARHFQFADATLSLLGEEIYRLCDEIVKRRLNKLISWNCETRADSVNAELLKKLKKAGCRWIAYGAETGSGYILQDIIGKKETMEDIIKAVRLTKKIGIKARCFFILGHYTETVDTIKETIQFALELNPDALSFGLLVPNPGTRLRELAEKGLGGMRILNNNWQNYNQFNYDCFELENLPLSELKKWQAKAYFTFYSRHPLKAMNLFLDQSGYNYRIKTLFKVIPGFIKKGLKK